MRILLRAVSGSAIAVLVVLALYGPDASAASGDTADIPRWRWPLAGSREVVEPFRAPAHEYGAGHRGVDLGASIHAAVTAPADGTVAFRGTVVDRPLLTIEHADGLVSTFEPLRTTLDPGDAVSVGQEIGLVDAGGHTAAGALHLGVRRDGVYINPMLLFGDLPRAVLLPCCEPL
ncbi:M23 family metallopeptidase [Microbacterium oxydans]|uniref:murein hydrolase activator EnvC family protein n=1 Tax=Microbacterium sp. B19(2022) TaxID=2914045 RepID=UPI001430E6B0|nr:M23 family metallopeptidase [Microbacterium sp. B19(2022)]NJI59148.1 M23 family metallopeptidase [Microbacterium sp. B19(2022)]